MQPVTRSAVRGYHLKRQGSPHPLRRERPQHPCTVAYSQGDTLCGAFWGGGTLHHSVLLIITYYFITVCGENQGEMQIFFLAPPTSAPLPASRGEALPRGRHQRPFKNCRSHRQGGFAMPFLCVGRRCRTASPNGQSGFPMCRGKSGIQPQMRMRPAVVTKIISHAHAHS